MVPFIYIVMCIVYGYIGITKTTDNVTYEFIAQCVNIVDYYYRGTYYFIPSPQIVLKVSLQVKQF